MVANDDVLVVEDARAHPVLASHLAVTRDDVVAYVGIPVHAPTGETLGALCVFDSVPREWTRDQVAALQDLATSVDTKIALRLAMRQTHLDHERLGRVLDGAANTLIITTDAAGVVTTMNPTAQEACTSVVSPRFGTLTLTDLGLDVATHALGGGLGEARDWVLHSSTGESRIISVRVSALHDNQGRMDGYVIIGDDVSARRRSEAATRDALEKRAEAVRRLEALEAQRQDFIATASHELRTPVTSIVGYAELLLDHEGDNLDRVQTDLVRKVDRNGRRLLNLVEDLLTLTRIESREVTLVRRPTDLTELAQRAFYDLIILTAGRDLDLLLDLPPDPCVVPADPTQLDRALQNVLMNAAKFTPDGGTVALALTPGEGSALLQVTDTGPGIAESELEAVLQPFYRTQEAQMNAVPGSGIGLTVADRVLRAHGGDVRITSTPGSGTTVSLAVPREH